MYSIDRLTVPTFLCPLSHTRCSPLSSTTLATETARALLSDPAATPQVCSPVAACLTCCLPHFPLMDHLCCRVGCGYRCLCAAVVGIVQCCCCVGDTVGAKLPLPLCGYGCYVGDVSGVKFCVGDTVGAKLPLPMCGYGCYVGDVSGVKLCVGDVATVWVMLPF
jgi:hypothetical protein